MPQTAPAYLFLSRNYEPKQLSTKNLIFWACKAGGRIETQFIVFYVKRAFDWYAGLNISCFYHSFYSIFKILQNYVTFAPIEGFARLRQTQQPFRNKLVFSNGCKLLLCALCVHHPILMRFFALERENQTEKSIRTSYDQPIFVFPQIKGWSEKIYFNHSTSFTIAF